MKIILHLRKHYDNHYMSPVFARSRARRPWLLPSIKLLNNAKSMIPPVSFLRPYFDQYQAVKKTFIIIT